MLTKPRPWYCGLAAALLAVVGAQRIAAAEPSAGQPPDPVRGSLQPPGAPYPPSEVFIGVSFDWPTHQRQAVGSDIWPISWADDDHQYTAWGDGGGFGGSDRKGRVSLGVARIEGPGEYPPDDVAQCASGRALPGEVLLETTRGAQPREAAAR